MLKIKIPVTRNRSITGLTPGTLNKEKPNLTVGLFDLSSNKTVCSTR